MRYFFKRVSENIAKPSPAGRYWVPLMLILACLGGNVYIRLYPAYFPQLREQAVRNVSYQYLQENIRDRALNNAKKNPLEIQFGMTQAAAILEDRINKEYQRLKDPFQSPGGQTYLLENDPFDWARYTQNVLKNGYPGDAKVRGESYDTYSLAPLGGATPRYAQLLFYVSAALYGAFSFFAFIPLERFLFFVPLFYTSVFLLTFYAFVRRWFSDLSAFLAVFLTGMSDVFINRTCAGWYDHDSLNLFLALAITGLLVEAMRSGTYKFRWLLFVLLASSFQALFMISWMGWWLFALILVSFFLLRSCVAIVRCARDSKRLLRELFFYGATAGVFFVAADFIGYRFLGVRMFSEALRVGNFVVPRWGTSHSPEIWPNLLYTVSELSAPKLQALSSFFYNKGILLLAVLGLLFVIFKEWDGKRKDVTLMMLCWVVFLAAATLKSQRFVFFLFTPFFFFLGVFLGDLLPSFLSLTMAGWKRRVATLAFATGLVLLILVAAKSGIATAERIYPLMNDGWYTALNYVDAHTPREAILNSWWDNGNWFKYYGKRRVVFDPHNQVAQLAYWMARVLLEKDESRAIAILRMLNNASNGIYEELSSVVPEPYGRLRTLERLLDSDRQGGERILNEYHVPAGTTQRILDLLYGKPARAYFIVDRSMLMKISNISFLGNWDFSKAYAYAHRGESRGDVVAALKKDFALAPENAEWIENVTAENGNPQASSEFCSSRYSIPDEPKKGKSEGGLTYFDNGIVYNQGTKEVLFFDGAERKYYRPRKVVFYENGVAREILNENGDFQKTVVLVKQPKNEQAFITDDPLAGSLLVKLYFLGGEGLHSFRPFYSDEENGIFIYEIDWGQT